MPGRNLPNVRVARIRERYAAGGITYEKLAEHEGIEPSTVGQICRGEIYLDAGGPISKPGKKRRKHFGRLGEQRPICTDPMRDGIVLVDDWSIVTCPRCLKNKPQQNTCVA